MMEDLINKWETMRALQAINPVAKLMDGDVVIRISEVENVLEHMPSAEPEHPDINVGNMDDCISRKAAIDCLNNVSFDCSMDQEVVEEEILKLPPVHPTISKTENVDGAISRQQAIDALKEKVFHNLSDEFYGAMQVLDELPSVQPKGTRLSTVCLLCKKPAVTFNTEDDIPYTNYSYCEDCLRKGLKLLREQKKICKNSKAAIEKDVAVEAISDELMSRFDISATYAYDVAESAVNRIEVMAKEMGDR